MSVKVTKIKKTTDEISENNYNVVAQIQNISTVSGESASSTKEVTSFSEQILVTIDEVTQHARDLHCQFEE